MYNSLIGQGQVLPKGTVFPFLTILLTLIFFIYFLRKGRQGEFRRIRSFAAADALEEAVGRSVEMQKPVHWSGGDRLWLSGSLAAAGLVAITILEYVAKMCARMGAVMICSVGGDKGSGSEALPLIYETVENAYLSEGKIEDFNPGCIRYISAEQYSYHLGVIGLLERERPGANICIGSFAAGAVPIGEAGHRVGAIGIGGNSRAAMAAEMVCIYDFALIGEETVAFAAKISEDPTENAIISSSDFCKMGIIVIMIAGAVLTIMGSPIILNLLKM